ncbi:MAG: TetR/AcrR family transcriptional regulator [Paucibacter sp.]|nr:TetR/AcrR family transcriptional regulator [Roseateles sp.]
MRATKTSTPNVPPARQRRKDARPQELRDAALSLFVEKGYAATRAEDVAARAGVSKGTLYLYYAGKEELFQAVVREHFSATIHDGMALMDEHRGSMSELLSLLMTRWWERVGQGPAGGLTKVVLAEGRNLPELAQLYLDEVIRPTHELLGALIERGIRSGEFRAVPVPETVHVLIGPLLHLMLSEHSLGHCLAVDAPAVLRTQLDLMLNGLKSGLKSSAVPLKFSKKP